MASTVTSASSSRPLIRGKLRLPEPRQQDPSASYTVATKLKDEVVLERPGATKLSCMGIPWRVSRSPEAYSSSTYPILRILVYICRSAVRKPDRRF